MTAKIFIENLPADMTEEGLKNVFTQIGEVCSVKIRTDLLARLSREHKGYGIVEMALDVDAYRAINCFEGAAFKNKRIHLEEAKPLLEKARSMFEHLAERQKFSDIVRRREYFKND
jgi:RNA recognition motif-containing protein